ncbi:ferredoxin [Peptococcus simiae]|uniref:Ferredoxin n=1 Tax=Peptococcus simiae TaxID=1643805 RepID=A0ABW9H0R7_9FIRM
MWLMVDQDACLGCASCEAVAPEIFSMNADGKAEALNEVTEDQKATAQEAIDICPVSCISWDEE